MRILVLAAFTLTLAACVSSGPTIDNAQLAGLQKGKTTADDIVYRFGKPSFNSDNLDGTRTTAYLQEGTRSNAAAMVAMIGAVASGTGSTANVNSIIFRFDTKGVLSSHERTSESQTALTASNTTTSGAAAPAATGSAPAGATTGSATQPAATRAAPPKAVPRADKLPDWLPSRDGRDTFNAAH